MPLERTSAQTGNSSSSCHSKSQDTMQALLTALSITAVFSILLTALGFGLASGLCKASLLTTSLAQNLPLFLVSC